MAKALEIDRLTVSYGRNVVLRDVTFSVEEGEYLGIMGPNGGGKSTLLKAILGIVKPSGGSVKIFGRSPGEGKSKIGYVPQFSDTDRSFPISVLEVVMTALLKNGLHPFLRFGEKDREEARRALAFVGLDGFEKRQIEELSGGEFQRLLIARALASKPSLLLLDEPTASVDAASRDKIYSLLGGLSKKMTVVMVTHDLTAVSREVKRLACLNQTLVYHGVPELSRKTVNALYGCPVDLIAHGVPHRVLENHDGGGCQC